MQPGVTVRHICAGVPYPLSGPLSALLTVRKFIVKVVSL